MKNKKTIENLKIGDKLYTTIKVTDDPISYEIQVLIIKEIDWTDCIKYWLCLDCEGKKHILFDADLDEYYLSSEEAFEATLERRKNALYLTKKTLKLWQDTKDRQEKEIKVLEGLLASEKENMMNQKEG